MTGSEKYRETAKGRVGVIRRALLACILYFHYASTFI